MSCIASGKKNLNTTIVSSHQPHFFPWLGYFDKMAKANLFLINDIAQLELKSPMHRNRIVDKNGTVRYINVSIEKKGYMEKQNHEIELSNWEETQKSLRGIIRDCYIRSCCFTEIWPMIDELLSGNYKRLIDIDMATIELGRKCLNIDTPMFYQSSMHFHDGATTSEKLAEKLSSIHTKIYLSGTGGRKYMDLNDFSVRGIKVFYQSFSYPIYSQTFKGEFIPNLSFLDLIFNCGLKESRELFWNNVSASGEIPENTNAYQPDVYLNSKI